MSEFPIVTVWERGLQGERPSSWQNGGRLRQSFFPRSCFHYISLLVIKRGNKETCMRTRSLPPLCLPDYFFPTHPSRRALQQAVQAQGHPGTPSAWADVYLECVYLFGHGTPNVSHAEQASDRHVTQQEGSREQDAQRQGCLGRSCEVSKCLPRSQEKTDRHLVQFRC